jgi:hypothetical protein
VRGEVGVVHQADVGHVLCARCEVKLLFLLDVLIFVVGEDVA